jgi:hypothetical protein
MHFWPLALCCLLPSLLAWRDWKWRRPVTFGWIAILFSSLQAYCYNTATHPALNPFSTWGFLPNTDSFYYLSNAVEIAEGVGIRAGFGARQMWPGFLALIHFCCHGDLKLMLSLLTLMQAAIMFATWEMLLLLLGRFAAFIWLCCAVLFYRTHIVGVFITEQLGLPLGMLAAVILLYAWRRRAMTPWLLGLSLATFALNARPGCYFVVAFLPLATFWRFREVLHSTGFWRRLCRGLAWRNGLYAVLVVSLCIALDSLAFHHLVKPPRIPSNFWMVLYGTAKGGTWVNAFDDFGRELYRGVGKMTDEQRLYNFAFRVKQAALKEVAAHPQMLLQVAWRAWQYVVLKQTFFVESSAKWWGRLLLLLSVLGLLASAWKNDLAMSDGFFHGLVWLGVFLSLPLAPPWDSGPRTYAATNPLLWLAPAAFCSWCARRLGERWFGKKPIHLPTSANRETDGDVLRANCRLVGLIGVLLVVTSVGLPSLLLELNRNRRMPRFSDLIRLQKQSSGIAEISGTLLRHNRGLAITPAGSRTFLPYIAREDFERGVPRGQDRPIGEFLKELPTGSYIALLGKPRYLICEPSLFPAKFTKSNISLQEHQWMAYKNVFALSKGLILTERQVAILCPATASHEIFWRKPRLPFEK